MEQTRKIFAVLLICICVFISGCSKGLNTDITDNSIEIEGRNNNTFVNPANPDDAYCYVEINGMKYLPFGIQNGAVNGDIIGDCIAYEAEDSNSRYYEVIGSDDFIACFYVGGMMEQWEFWRSENTIGKEIEIPDFIESLDYEVWK